jgi:ketopantoate reductase
MKVLIIGAGAVGQVYGHCLHRAGVEVSVFVKEKYAEECKRGFLLNRLRPFRAPRAERFDGAPVLSSVDEVAARKWDQVWFCVSSTAMHGAWLEPMLQAIQGATLVSLQPGMNQSAFLKQRFPEEHIVFGAIGLVSYQAPLKGESLDPSVAYWFPPFSTSPFSGEPDAVKTIVSRLRKGACPASSHKDAVQWASVPTAVMMPHLAALEANSWSFAALIKSPLLMTAASASRQAIDIVSAHNQTRPPMTAAFIKPWVMRWLFRLAPVFAPFDLETYIQYHFTKVGDQTRYLLRDYTAKGRLNSQPVDALESLEQSAWPS